MAEQICPACGCYISGEGYEKRARSIAVSPVPPAAPVSAAVADQRQGECRMQQGSKRGRTG